MRLSMVMIAKDEQDNVRPCFESFWTHVDEVVLCDTGSTDGTVVEAERYAAERGEPGKLVVGHFEWCDDFGAARSEAHSLATGDVHSTIDLDDRLVGGENLRGLAGELLSDPETDSVCLLRTGALIAARWSPRILRAPVSWRGPTWEEPSAGLLSHHTRCTSKVSVHHTRALSRTRRDLDIALRWAAAEPENYRPLFAVACEAINHVDCSVAVDYCKRVLALPDLVAEIRASACLMCARALDLLGRSDEAERLAYAAIGWCEDTPTLTELAADRDRVVDGSLAHGTPHEAWLLLARQALVRGDHEEALRCATESVTYAITEDRVQNARLVAVPAAAALALEGRGPENAILTVLGVR